MALQRAVFFDRDGILNRAVVRGGRPFPPDRLEEFEILEDARTACRLLKGIGFRLICVTNQPEVARGTTSLQEVGRFNRKLLETLPLDEIRVCSHDDADNCYCRKPKPGLLLASAAELRLDLSLSFMVGDRWRDVEAGKAAGCRTILVDYSYSERRQARPDFTATSVVEASRWICDQVHSENDF